MASNGPEPTREAHETPPSTAGKARADAGNRTPNLLITKPLSADSCSKDPHHITASAGQNGRNRPAKRTLADLTRLLRRLHLDYLRRRLTHTEDTDHG